MKRHIRISIIMFALTLNFLACGKNDKEVSLNKKEPGNDSVFVKAVNPEYFIHSGTDLMAVIDSADEIWILQDPKTKSLREFQPFTLSLLQKKALAHFAQTMQKDELTVAYNNSKKDFSCEFLFRKNGTTFAQIKYAPYTGLVLPDGTVLRWPGTFPLMFHYFMTDSLNIPEPAKEIKSKNRVGPWRLGPIPDSDSKRRPIMQS